MSNLQLKKSNLYLEANYRFKVASLFVITWPEQNKHNGKISRSIVIATTYQENCRFLNDAEVGLLLLLWLLSLSFFGGKTADQVLEGKIFEQSFANYCFPLIILLLKEKKI